MDKKLVFGMYNKARSAARKGKLDLPRTNKALGILMSADSGKAKFEKYLTTTKSCSCPDFHRTGKPCKHMIAKMIEVRAKQGKAQPVVETVYIASNQDVLMAAQESGKYQLHAFYSESQYDQFVQAHPTMQFVKPSAARGRRINPDIDHTQEYN